MEWPENEYDQKMGMANEKLSVDAGMAKESQTVQSNRSADRDRKMKALILLCFCRSLDFKLLYFYNPLDVSCSKCN